MYLDLFLSWKRNEGESQFPSFISPLLHFHLMSLFSYKGLLVEREGLAKHNIKPQPKDFSLSACLPATKVFWEAKLLFSSLLSCYFKAPKCLSVDSSLAFKKESSQQGGKLGHIKERNLKIHSLSLCVSTIWVFPVSKRCREKNSMFEENLAGFLKLKSCTFLGFRPQWLFRSLQAKK